MARKATATTKARTPRQQAVPAPDATKTAVASRRRGAKAATTTTELGALAAGTDQGVVASDQSAKPAPGFLPGKARRGRPPNAKTAPEPAAVSDDTFPGVDVAAERDGAAPSSQPAEPTTGDVTDPQPGIAPKPRRGRPPKVPPAEAILPTSFTMPKKSTAGSRKAPAAVASGTSAAQLDPVSGMVTFDWPIIEQVAASPGANQAMAKLLLAARAEGANSRWPF